MRAISFPESSFPLLSGWKTRALGATISGMRHRCRLYSETGWAEFGYFPLLFQNGCSQSSRISTAGQGERRPWARACWHRWHGGLVVSACTRPWIERSWFKSWPATLCCVQGQDSTSLHPGVKINGHQQIEDSAFNPAMD